MDDLHTLFTSEAEPVHAGKSCLVAQNWDLVISDRLGSTTGADPSLYILQFYSLNKIWEAILPPNTSPNNKNENKNKGS